MSQSLVGHVSTTYRQEATRAFAASISVAALVFAVSGATVWAGRAGVRRLALAVVDACQRLWMALPRVLQVGLVLSVAVGLLAAGYWAYTVARQWRATHRLARRLEQGAVPLPQRLGRLLETHRLTDRLMLVDDPRPIALTIGLLAPRIAVSTALLSLLEDDELEAVVLHEQSHMRHLDPVFLLISRTLGTGMFFVPVVKALAGRHQAAAELAADEDVITHQGHPLILASAMLKMLGTAPRAAPGAFTGSSDLRLARLLEGRVVLPDVPHVLEVRSAAALAMMGAPVIAAHGLAGAMIRMPFFLRCAI